MSPVIEVFLIALNGAGVVSFITFLIKLYSSVEVIKNEIKNIKFFIGLKDKEI